MAKRPRAGQVPCAACDALCCRYIMVKVDPPRRRCDRDEHRWFLMHRGVELRIDRRRWYMLIRVPCRNLRRDGRCRIYADRPDVCREHDPRECEFHGDESGSIIFRTVEEYDRYLERRGMPWRPEGTRRTRHRP